MALSTQDFDRLISGHRKIKEDHVDKRLNFYIDRVDSKRVWAQRASVAILTLSLTIPIIANLPFTTKDIVVSVMSASIALISGFSQIHRWQDLWKEYSAAIVRIEAAIASWEIKIARVNQLDESEKVSQTLGAATETLVQNVMGIVSTEMDQFFQSAQSPKNEQ